MGSMPYSRYILYPIPWYSFLIVLGAALAIFLASREEERAGLQKDTIIDLSLRLLPCGIIGARLYYVLFSWDQFKNNLLSVFRIWEGGIAIYGAIISGFLVLVLFCRRRKLQPLLLCDLIAPGLALAQGIGRWGNYFNMEAYGLTIVNPRYCFFPLAVQIPSASGSEWHLATFFLESAWDLSLFAFLMICRRKLFRKQGDTFLFYVFFYAAGRLIIEDLRLDSLYAVSSVRISQLLSLLLCVGILLYYGLRAHRENRCLPLVRYLALLFSGIISVFLLMVIVHWPIRLTLTVRTRLFLLCSYSVVMILLLLAMYIPKAGED